MARKKKVKVPKEVLTSECRTVPKTECVDQKVKKLRVLVGLDNPIVQYAVSRNMQQGVVCALQVYPVCSFRCLTRRMSARSSRGASARRSPSRSARLLQSK